MQGAELWIVASLYLNGQQMRLIAYHEDTHYFQIQTKIRRKSEQIQTNFRWFSCQIQTNQQKNQYQIQSKRQREGLSQYTSNHPFHPIVWRNDSCLLYTSIIFKSVLLPTCRAPITMIALPANIRDSIFCCNYRSIIDVWIVCRGKDKKKNSLIPKFILTFGIVIPKIICIFGIRHILLCYY